MLAGHLREQVLGVGLGLGFGLEVSGEQVSHACLMRRTHRMRHMQHVPNPNPNPTRARRSVPKLEP